MATRAAVVSTRANGSLLIKWPGLLNGGDGTPVEVPCYGERNFGVYGTCGASCSCQPEGSNEDCRSPVYAQLTGPSGTGNALIALTAVGVKAVVESPLLIRPRVTAGDGTTNLTAALICKPYFRM